MTEALKQAGLPGLLAPKAAPKNGKRADPSAFGDALRSASNTRNGKAGDTKSATDAPLVLWQRASAEPAEMPLVVPAKSIPVTGKTPRDADKKFEKSAELETEADELPADELTVEEPDFDDIEAPDVVVVGDVVLQFSATLELLRRGTSDAEPSTKPAKQTNAGAPPPAKVSTEAGAQVDLTETTAVAAGKIPDVEPGDGVLAEAPTAVDPGNGIEIDAAKVVSAPVQPALIAPQARSFAPALISTPAKPGQPASRASAVDASKVPTSGEATAPTTAVASAVPDAAVLFQRPADDQTADQQSENEAQKSAAPEIRRIEPAPVQARAGIFTEHAAGEPLIQPLSANANAITTAISGAEGMRPSTETLAQTLLRLSSSPGGQVQSLKIQLHPAELGVVTAQLRFAGDQLSVELQVENAEAYHRLTMDTETIAMSLRSLGFDVDQVSIQQPQMVVSASARADVSGNPAGGFSRDASSFQSWNSSNGDDRTGGQASGRGRENGGNRNETAAPVRQNGTGSGIYI